MLTRLLDRSRVTVYPRLVVGGLVFAWVVSALLGQGGLDRAGNVIGTDFLAFYSAATLIAEDPGADPYDLEVLGARQRELVSAMSETEVVAYLSPPTALLLGLLLSIHLYTYDLALALVAFWLAIGALGLGPGSAPPLDGDGVLRWTALVWTVAFVGPILTLLLGVLLASMFGVPATVGVTTFVAGAAGLRLLGMAGRQ